MLARLHRHFYVIILYKFLVQGLENYEALPKLTYKHCSTLERKRGRHISNKILLLLKTLTSRHLNLNNISDMRNFIYMGNVFYIFLCSIRLECGS